MLTVGCKPGHINVFDSLHMRLPSDVKKVIGDLIRYKGDTITISYTTCSGKVVPMTVASLPLHLQLPFVLAKTLLQKFSTKL